MAEKLNMGGIIQDALPHLKVGDVADCYAQIEGFLEAKNWARAELFGRAVVALVENNLNAPAPVMPVANDNVEGWHDRLTQELGDKDVAAATIVVHLLEKAAEHVAVIRMAQTLQKAVETITTPPNVYSQQRLQARLGGDRAQEHLVKVMVDFGGVTPEVAKVAVNRFVGALPLQRGAG